MMGVAYHITASGCQGGTVGAALCHNAPRSPTLANRRQQLGDFGGFVRTSRRGASGRTVDTNDRRRQPVVVERMVFLLALVPDQPAELEHTALSNPKPLR